MSVATQNLTLGMTGTTGVPALAVGASQTWNISSATTLSIVPNHTVGNDRTLDITGLGQITNSGWLQVGSTFEGTNAKNGTVNHTGGTWSSSVTNTALFIGHAATTSTNTNLGTYNLSGGTIALVGTQEIRLGNQYLNAEGVMNVTSGSITSSTATTVLKAGYVNGSKGAYIQSGGVVTLGRMEVASSIAASLGSGTTGTASVSAGSLSLTTLAIGTLNNGSFTLSGSGILNLSGAATVGSAATSSGTLNLNGGTLNLATTTAPINKNATGVVNAAGGKISNQAGANVSLNTAMVLGTDGLTIAPSVQNSNRWVTLSGNLTGTGGLTLNATGTNTVVLSGSNSFEGSINLQSGYLGNSSVNAIPTGVAATVNGSWRLDNDVVLSTLTGSGNFFRGDGSSLLTVGHGDASSSFAGKINTNATQTISLTKIGAGTLTLTANNTTNYTGITTVKAGTLKLEGNGAIESSPTIVVGDLGSSGAVLDVTAKTGGFTVGAAQTLKGIGTISGNVSGADGANLAPGDSSPGTLGISGNLTISAMAAGTGTLAYELDALAGTNDKIAVSGNLTIGVGSLGFNNFVFTNLGGLQVGTYKLITSSGINPGDTLDAANLSGAIGALTGTLQITGGDLELVVSAGGPGPVHHFDISAIASPQTVGTPITGITITAKEASNTIATGFTGTVTFGGTAGCTGTSASFVLGVLNSVSVIPTNAGSNLTLTVDDGALHTGSTTITSVKTQYDTWSGGAAFDTDTNNDSVTNGVAWVLGAANPAASATALLPTFDNTTDPAYFIFTYRRSDVANTAANTTIAVQYGSNLTGWTTAVAGPDIIITPIDNFYSVTPGVDKVEVKIKRTLAVGSKLFTRLNVVQAP